MRFISDPGHGWLEVATDKYPDAIEYGTGYGYQNGKYIYLEEDCEAPAFLKAHPEIDRSTIKDVYQTRTRIRGFAANEPRMKEAM